MMNKRFYLYSDKDIENFSDYLTVYSKEIFDVLKFHPKRTLEPHNADFFITCFSNESNYPVFGRQDLGSPKKSLSKEQMVNKCCYISYGYHLTFFHSSNKISYPFINIPYVSKLKDAIRLCPPTPTNIEYCTDSIRSILVSFKGNFNRKSHIDGENYRNLIVKKIKKFESENIIIESRNIKKNSYKDLLHKSIFSLVIEGDLPWSYRLTEVINAGSIPIIILPKHGHILPFQQILDYSKFSILLHYNEIDTFFDTIVNQLDHKHIQKLQDNLYHVNQQVFINRTSQLDSLLKCIEHTYSCNKFPHTNIETKDQYIVS